MSTLAHGGGSAPTPPVVVTATLSKSAVFSLAESWLVTASPKREPVASEAVVLPTTCHTDPSAEMDAVNVDPERESFSQVGSDRCAPPIHRVADPVVVRDMNSMSPVGRMSRMTFAAFAAADSRTITPAFAYGFVFARAVPRA